MRLSALATILFMGAAVRALPARRADAPAPEPQFVLNSNGDNVLQAEERVLCPFDKTVSFVYHKDGAIALEENGKTYGGRLQVVPADIQTAGLYLESDGELVVKDMEGSDTGVPGNHPGENGAGGSPYILNVDIDRRARIRDASDVITWEFPALRAPQMGLESGRMDFLRGQETLTSPNGQYTLTINKRGVMSSNKGKTFNDVPNSITSDPRVLLLKDNGQLVLLDSRGLVKFSSKPDSSANPVQPYVAEISDEGWLRILDGNTPTQIIDHFALDPVKVPPPPQTTSTTVASSTTKTSSTSTSTTVIASTTSPAAPPKPTQICEPLNQVKDECVILARTHSITPFGAFGKTATDEIKKKWWWLNCNCFVAWGQSQVNPWYNTGKLTKFEIDYWNKEQCSCKVGQAYYNINLPYSWGTASADVQKHWNNDKCKMASYCWFP
ncbi:hypothetical protein HDU86_007658 [Geranomyces michiganensis]|nr:hypothetical protein HDU86_007658 [Geranomyces michiganensis]